MSSPVGTQASHLPRRSFIILNSFLSIAFSSLPIVAMPTDRPRRAFRRGSRPRAGPIRPRPRRARPAMPFRVEARAVNVAADPSRYDTARRPQRDQGRARMPSGDRAKSIADLSSSASDSATNIAVSHTPPPAVTRPASVMNRGGHHVCLFPDARPGVHAAIVIINPMRFALGGK
jgi:hypothetical protein